MGLAPCKTTAGLAAGDALPQFLLVQEVPPALVPAVTPKSAPHVLGFRPGLAIHLRHFSLSLHAQSRREDNPSSQRSRPDIGGIFIDRLTEVQQHSV